MHTSADNNHTHMHTYACVCLLATNLLRINAHERQKDVNVHKNHAHMHIQTHIYAQSPTLTCTTRVSMHSNELVFLSRALQWLYHHLGWFSNFHVGSVKFISLSELRSIEPLASFSLLIFFLTLLLYFTLRQSILHNVHVLMLRFLYNRAHVCPAHFYLSILLMSTKSFMRILSFAYILFDLHCVKTTPQRR